MSYHDLFITTDRIKRTSIFDLPYGYNLTCSRVRGWALWLNNELIAEEYSSKSDWFVLDVEGHVILDTRNRDE